MENPTVYRFQASDEGSIIVSIANALEEVVGYEPVGPLADEISCDGLEQLFSEQPVQEDLQVRFSAEDCMITISGDRSIKIRQ